MGTQAKAISFGQRTRVFTKRLHKTFARVRLANKVSRDDVHQGIAETLDRKKAGSYKQGQKGLPFPRTVVGHYYKHRARRKHLRQLQRAARRVMRGAA